MVSVGYHLDQSLINHWPGHMSIDGHTSARYGLTPGQPLTDTLLMWLFWQLWLESCIFSYLLYTVVHCGRVRNCRRVKCMDTHTHTSTAVREHVCVCYSAMKLSNKLCNSCAWFIVFTTVACSLSKYTVTPAKSAASLLLFIAYIASQANKYTLHVMLVLAVHRAVL